MKAPALIKRINRWLFPVLVGSGITAGLLWLFLAFVRLRPPPAAAQPLLTRPAIVLVASDQDDVERRELTDLDPLFLPTSHNTSVLTLPAQARREPGSMSFSYPAKLSELEARGGVSIAEQIAVPARPIEALSLGDPPPSFPELGRADLPIPALTPRLAFMEVAEAGSGRIVLSAELGLQPGLTPPAGDWMPVEFLVAISPAGIVGLPVVTNSSTSEEVEAFFSDLIARKFSLGARLTPGFYSVHLGP